MDAAPRSRDEFLVTPLRDLLGCWLDVRCAAARCTKVVCVPVRMIAAKRGGQLRLQDVLARMRCAQCGEPPVKAAITDSPIDIAPHEAVDAAKWRVELWP